MSAISGSDDDDWHLPDYVHMLLLWRGADRSNRVLMLNQTSKTTWDLPFFTYPDSLHHNGDRCAADLERMLVVSPLPDRRSFAVVAELLGSHGGAGLTGDDPVGFSRLMLVDPQVPLCDLRLPSQAEWKDAHFMASLLETLDHDKGNRPALEVTLEYLRAASAYIAEHCDPGYLFRWFNSAANWLRTEVERHGNIPTGKVVQEHVSSSSTLLSLESSSGTFYLKAPALGSEELSITTAVALLFPEDTVYVLATSENLHSFIMRGFNHIQPREKHYEAFVKTLGNIQLQSLQHLDTLKTAGCEDRGPNMIAEKLRQWTNDGDMRSIFGCEYETFNKRVPIVVDVCSRLATYSIPMTLVHGDCDLRNATVVGAKGDCDGPESGGESGENCCDDSNRSSERMLLFDWQYACISHPFCDLHELHEELSDDTLNMYLDLCSAYESRDRAREAFELAKNLGWCLKMWTSIDCFRLCNLQRKSSTAEFVYDAFTALDSGLSKILRSISTGGSPECSAPAADVDG